MLIQFFAVQMELNFFIFIYNYENGDGEQIIMVVDTIKAI